MSEKTCIRVYADIKQIQNCKSEIENVGHSILKLSNVLNLAGNEVRLKIMYLLFSQDRLCVCDLSDILNMSPPAISQHLRKLKDGGMIKNQRVAQTIYYTLTLESKKLLEGFFEQIKSNRKVQLV